MKGWLAAYDVKKREKLAKLDRLRRHHVQSYAAGFKGFCPWCSVPFREGMVHDEGCKANEVRPDGKRRRMLIVDWEATTVDVIVKGKHYKTENTGWARRVVRGEVFWTKTVAEGVIALLHQLEAAQAGVVQEKREVDPTLSLPSVTSTALYTPPRTANVPHPSQPRPAPKPGPRVPLTAAQLLSAEAKRLSDLPDRSLSRSENLRLEHVKRFSVK